MYGGTLGLARLAESRCVGESAGAVIPSHFQDSNAEVFQKDGRSSFCLRDQPAVHLQYPVFALAQIKSTMSTEDCASDKTQHAPLLCMWLSQCRAFSKSARLGLASSDHGLHFCC